VSERAHRAISVACALVALAIGIYLSYLHWKGEVVPCAINHGCETVAQSKYAAIAGVRVSTLGAIGSLVMVGLAIPSRPDVRTIGLLVAVGGALFSIYLTILELTVIDAICQWCVGSFVMWVLLAINESVRYRRLQAAGAV
jgi:uncharacterized membrane protein